MIEPGEISEYIRSAFPDASVRAIDTTGTRDHWRVEIVSDAFKGRNLLDRHRMVQKALAGPMGDGRIHALELKVQTSEGE